MRVTAAENVLIHQFEGEAVVLNLTTETYYRLNGIAADMWNALTTSESVEQAQTALLTMYDVSPETLKQDIEDFINYLKETQLVVVGD